MHRYYVAPKSDDLMHYGIKRRSGRYPYGSGERPYQGEYRIKKYTTPGVEKAKRNIKNIGRQAAIYFPPYLIYSLTHLQVYKPKSYFVQKDGPIEKLSEFKKKEVETTPEADVKKANKGYGKNGTVENCPNCVSAFEMRRRGYDVQARRSSYGHTSSEIMSWFGKKDSDIKRPNFDIPIQQENENRKQYYQRAYDNFCNALEKEGDGARGVVFLEFEQSYGAHVFNWTVENGTTKFYDAQTGKVDTDKLMSLSDIRTLSYARLDDGKLQDIIAEHVVSRKGK